MIAFGPVPSRRLGYSLGINHVPAKHCTLSCVYCQVGRTTHLDLKRQDFYPVAQIVGEVERRILECSQAEKTIDYLTLVPDGEPTLDANLGLLINELKQFGIPVAVISNASLIDWPDVQDELLQADWVSLKVDSVEEGVWKKINRPHRHLNLSNILNGMLTFRSKFRGELVTETMLVAGLNVNENAAIQLSHFLLALQPFKSYLSIPIRPPAEAWATSPSSQSLSEVLSVLSNRIPFMDLLFDTEVGEFVSTGNLAEDLLSITAVHPMREDPLREMVKKTGGDWKVVEELLAAGEISCIQYRGERFYMRHFPRQSSRNG